MLNEVLAGLIRRGEVTVSIPEMDMERLEEIIRSRCMQTLRRVKKIVYDEDILDREKVAMLYYCLEGW